MPRSLTARPWRSAAFPVRLLAALLASPLDAQGPEARLKGRVILRGTNVPLPGATVGVEGTGLAAQSDSLCR
jgi:hypothetical protein